MGRDEVLILQGHKDPQVPRKWASNCQIKYLHVLSIPPLINIVNAVELNTVPSDFQLMT